MSCRFKEISLANWPRIVQPAKLLHCHHLVYRHLKRREGVYIYIYINYTSFLFETPGFWSLDLSSLIAHPCDHILCCLKEGWDWEALLQFVLWSLFVMRGVTWHSWIMVCCFPWALQHVPVGSRIRGNSLQPVTARHHSFPVFCAVGKWWLMLSCLPPCQEKPFAVFSVSLLLCHENAVNKEPLPVWCRTACAWLGSAPLPGAPESCPGLMW